MAGFNNVKDHRVGVGNTRTPLGVTLKQGGSAVDLTSLTVEFQMVSSGGVEKVAWTSANVTIVDASAGEVQYDFQSADVDTEGVYFGTFRVVEGAEYDNFPVDKRKLRIHVIAAN